MKAFYDLTEAGQTRRLRKLAFEVLKQYDLVITRLSLITKDTHTIFRVDTEEGKKFALRIYSEGEVSFEDNQVEMFFLDELSDSGIPVPRPVSSTTGDLITFARVYDVPEERRCVLFDWIPGHCLEEEIKPEYYFQLGQQMARLHDVAKSIQVPETLDVRRWDQVFYYRDEPVVIHDAAYSNLFTPQRLKLIDETISRSETLFRELYDRPDQILIHADLHFWNVHVHRGKLFLLDFEDALLGYPVQDVAVTLSYGRSRDDYEDLSTAYKEGYCNISPWPVKSDCQLQTLWMARNIMFINYVAHTRALEPETYIQRRCEDLQEYLDNCS